MTEGRHEHGTPAILDETGAPEVAVLTRISGSRMLRGKIEHRGTEWVWHFVLDSDPTDRRQGTAHAYEVARESVLEALAALGVQVRFRQDSKPPAKA
jgi:hypothetical protein